MTVTIKYHPDYSKDAQDAVFYTDTDCVACVSNGQLGFHVRVCGDTKAYVWNDEIDKAGEEDPIATVRFGDEWATVGIHTDEDLGNAEDRIEWVNNSWYEVFADNTEDEDVFDGEVYHTVDEAIEAIEIELSRWHEVIVTRSTHYKVRTQTQAEAFEVVLNGGGEVIAENTDALDYIEWPD